ncbi:MAG TPA: hypothetical protein VJR89_25545, partial [Polyangiales bacterium]|nr:hypothetical protein [Polyangiales bacterium]
LTKLGTSVVSEAAPGYAALLQTSKAPPEVWQRVARYFDELEHALGAEVPRARNEPLPEPASAQFWPRDGAQSVTETPHWFGPKRSLFGILTEAPQPKRDAPCVVLLSGGVNPQVGTNRLHTRWARDWALDLGLTSFRFDLSGIGDSATAPGAEDAQLYSLSTVDDVREALDFLERTTGARHFALVGLCSGAFAGFHTALADRRVTELGLLNLLRYYWNANDSIESVQAQRRRQLRSLRYYWTAVGRADPWRKLLRGDVQLARIGSELAARSARRVLHAGAYWLDRVRGAQSAPVSQLAHDFRVLAERGASSLVVYNGDEPMLDDFQEQLGPELPRLTALGSIRLEVIDNADHIFSPLSAQRALTQRLTAYLREVSG